MHDQFFELSGRNWELDEHGQPKQTRIETVADDADLEGVYNTARHLLYLAVHECGTIFW